jgi:uncharacterized protein VirK/YbjX
MKKQKKQSKKIWKTLKTAFKWLLFIILLFLLLSLLKDFINHYNFLADKVQQQSQDINDLKQTVTQLKNANSHLVNQVQYEHSKVEHLQQQLSVKINNQPVSDLHTDVIKHTEKKFNISDLNPTTTFVPITIIGILSVLKEMGLRFAF